jgi:hypothetical protein
MNPVKQQQSKVQGLHIITPEMLDPKERIAVYGVPGVGKTTFGLSVPESWGKITYVAYDDSAETLRPATKEVRARTTVVKPRGANPLLNFEEISNTSWSKETGAGVLVLDTITTATIRLLLWIANKGFFSGSSGDKHIIMGDGKGGLSQAIPLPADYGAVQNVLRSFYDSLFQANEDIHILSLFHQRFGQDQQKNFIGGPATVGSAMLEELPSIFDTVIRLERKQENVKDGKGVVVNKSYVQARTDHHQYWIAKVREGGGKGNPIPIVRLDETGKNFWPQYLEVVNG